MGCGAIPHGCLETTLKSVVLVPMKTSKLPCVRERRWLSNRAARRGTTASFHVHGRIEFLEGCQ